MQTLESLKRKIQTAEDLASVVRTMKTLAAVSIHQYEQAVDSLGDYYGAVEDGRRILFWNSPGLSELIHEDLPRRAGAVVFGSDQGMCGQFNEQLASFALEHLQADGGAAAGDPAESCAFIAVGARAAARLADAGCEVDAEFPVAGSATGITPLVQDLLTRLQSWRVERGLGRILLFYNRRKTASSYQPHHYELLPIRPHRFQSLKHRVWPGRSLPSFTMDRSELLSRLIRQYLFVSLFRACAESAAGENASRIASMQAADRNIQDRLVQLRGQYNEQRQTTITEELLEVVTGFEALAQTD